LFNSPFPREMNLFRLAYPDACLGFFPGRLVLMVAHFSVMVNNVCREW
jgi:hypothetical protein